MRALLLCVFAIFGVSCSGERQHPEPARFAPAPAAGVTVSAAAAPAAAAETVTTIEPNPTDSAAERIAELQHELSSAVVELADSVDTDFLVPAPARPKLQALEGAFLAYLRERLPALLTTPEVNAKTAEAELMTPLREAGVVEGFGSQSFGGLIALDVRPEAEDLVGVVVTLGLSCGSDSTLYLFQGRGRDLRHVLTAGAAHKESIADGQLFLEHAVIPTTSGVFLAYAHATPWCTSAWRELRYGVLEATDDPAHPKTLFQQKDSVWIGNGFVDLTTTRDAFELRFDTWDTSGMDVVRQKALAYRRHGSSWQLRKR